MTKKPWRPNDIAIAIIVSTDLVPLHLSISIVRYAFTATAEAGAATGEQAQMSRSPADGSSC